MQRRSVLQRLSSARPAAAPPAHAARAQCLARLPRHPQLQSQQRSLSSDAGAGSPPPPQKLAFGQPLFETHPHLLKRGEVTPGISALEYAMRRAKLAAELPDNSIAIIPSSHVKYRSGPVFYDFHQNPDFYYLTGFLEPEAVCVIIKESGQPEGEHIFQLYVRDKDPKSELWDGARSGVEAATEVFNADEGYNIDNLELHLEPYLRGARSVYTDLSVFPSRAVSVFHASFVHSAPDTFSFVHRIKKKAVPLAPVMHGLRNVKSAAEVANMRKAGKISGRAFNMAMQERFVTERGLHAFLEYRFKVGGCEKEAYVPVVAGGENACTIHYTRNDETLKNGDLVLVDAGGQYGGYVTDITRTWPTSGTFTAAQRDLYSVVLAAQKQCVSLCRENASLSLDAIHSVAETELKSGLKQIGFDVGGRNMDTLFPHHVGHFVGLDVHDCHSCSRSKGLVEGQCVTIEPGVYVPNDDRWPVHFRGMGIRIEDSICVGQEHPIVLSVEAAKEIVDIEALGESIRAF
ncbi:peptidase M24, structural domain-containing protein [Morchella snyderi]|nr:peptidase M24, structural domain-containing protein [Morchella snyderi]